MQDGRKCSCTTVSYTHLDVYKRQAVDIILKQKSEVKPCLTARGTALWQGGLLRRQVVLGVVSHSAARGDKASGGGVVAACNDALRHGKFQIGQPFLCLLHIIPPERLQRFARAHALLG